jgi:hypothetical protein
MFPAVTKRKYEAPSLEEYILILNGFGVLGDEIRIGD